MGVAVHADGGGQGASLGVISDFHAVFSGQI